MGFEQIDEACQAGARAENADFATPTGNAGINPLKIAKRNIYIPFHFQDSGSVISGTVAFGGAGAFPGLTLGNGGAGYLLAQGFMPRGEISPGERGTLKVAWYVGGATTGNLRLVADLKPVISGTANLSSAITRNVIAAAVGSANTIIISKMEFPPAFFNNNQLLGLKLARDPSNTLDTLGADVVVIAIWMEILGRC
jgi:hypothetical protein